jgi:hypothetical protein
MILIFSLLIGLAISVGKGALTVQRNMHEARMFASISEYDLVCTHILVYSMFYVFGFWFFGFWVFCFVFVLF